MNITTNKHTDYSIYGIKTEDWHRARFRGWSRILTSLALLTTSIVLFSCKKFIEVDPPDTSTTANNAFKDDATAASVLTGIYALISSQTVDYYNPGLATMYLHTALSADELTLYNTNNPYYFGFYSNNLTGNSLTYWNNLYTTIFTANTAVEGLTASTSLTPEVRQQLLGEAKFIRAFCYFYLVNLYGDVPLVTSSNYKENALLSRISKSQVYELIKSDLTEAKELLKSEYMKADALTAYGVGSEERIRPNKWAAAALLARVNLFTGDWTGAESESSDVINQTVYYSLVGLEDVFKMNSSESIWALQPVFPGANSNTGDGFLFVLPASGPNNYPNEVYLSRHIIDSFELGDKRKALWTDSISAGAEIYYFPFKYKAGQESTSTSEYIIVLRLAEQYLVRAEARAQQGNLQGAKDDMNALRTRAELPNTTLNGQASLLNGILRERRSELFTEWGHRWLDLKRTGKIDQVMNLATPQKGGTWNTYKAFYPIPRTEITLNPNIAQNTGY